MTFFQSQILKETVDEPLKTAAGISDFSLRARSQEGPALLYFRSALLGLLNVMSTSALTITGHSHNPNSRN